MTFHDASHRLPFSSFRPEPRPPAGAERRNLASAPSTPKVSAFGRPPSLAGFLRSLRFGRNDGWAVRPSFETPVSKDAGRGRVWKHFLPKCKKYKYRPVCPIRRRRGETAENCGKRLRRRRNSGTGNQKQRGSRPAAVATGCSTVPAFAPPPPRFGRGTGYAARGVPFRRPLHRGPPIDRAAASPYFPASILPTRAPGFVSGRHGLSGQGPAQEQRQHRCGPAFRPPPPGHGAYR